MATKAWCKFIDQIADHFHQAEVLPFVLTGNIVNLADATAREHLPQRLSVVAHIKPVAHVQSVSVNRDGLAREYLLNDDWNELFGMLIGAVVVRAIRDEGRQAVGVMERPDEHVRAGLAGGVG